MSASSKNSGPSKFIKGTITDDWDNRLPVRFSERTIVVLDSVLIEPPYAAENCKAPQKNHKELQRVKELVTREREKLTKDNTLGRRGG